MTTARAAAVRPLVAGVVDYAGLFPPASLGMAAAVRRYAAHRRSPEHWMLGRFVVPAARLEEFEAAALDFLPTHAGDAGDVPDASAASDPDVATARTTPWRLAVIVGPGADEPATSLARAAAFNARHGADTGNGAAVVDAVEWRPPPAPPDQIVPTLAAAAAARERHLPTAALYVEVAAAGDHAAIARAAADAGVRLKLRTGGVTADAFPPPSAVLDFLEATTRCAVPSKLTAGLHHALRGEHALTYEADAPRGTMYGFLNVLVAAALLRAGHSAAAVAPVLEERDAAALEFAGDGVRWRGLAADPDVIGATRAAGVIGFGSCAFDEPVADLRALGLLPLDAGPLTLPTGEPAR